MGDILNAITNDSYWIGPGTNVPDIAYPHDQEAPGGTYYRDEIALRYHALGGEHQAAEIYSTDYLDFPELADEGVVSLLRASQWRGGVDQLEAVIANHPLGIAGMAANEQQFDELAAHAQHPSAYLPGARWVDLEDGRMVEYERIFAIPSHVRRDESGQRRRFLIGVRSDEVQVVIPKDRRTNVEKPQPRPERPLQRAPHGVNIVLGEMAIGRVYQEKTGTPGLKLRRKIVIGHLLSPVEEAGSGILKPRSSKQN